MTKSSSHIILDFTGCRHYHEFHHRLKDTLKFPDYYGCNLDALWDSLSRESIYGCDAFISIRGIRTMTDDLREYMERVYPIFERNKELQQKYGRFFDYEIVD